MQNWLPASLTASPALELHKLTLLGAFLGLSTFADENVCCSSASFS